MKSLIHYDEFGTNMGFPSMTDFFHPTPYENMDKIIEYLEQGNPTYVRGELPKDVFTGERIPCEYIGMTDGVYSWNSVLPYYVRKYNLKLPKEFENHVLDSLSKLKKPL